MKNLLIILALAASAYSQTVVNLENKGSAYPVISSSFGEINLDTMELNTGSVVFNLSGSPVVSMLDTIGTASMWCRDSSGTDTTAVVLKWQGNSRPDGKATWENIDSVEVKDITSTLTVGKAAVVNSNTKAYQAIRFIIRNKLGTAVGRKAMCKDVLLSKRPRLGAIR